MILFVNHWLSRHWDHKTVIRCLKLSAQTSVIGTVFVDSIGGPGVLVEKGTQHQHPVPLNVASDDEGLDDE